VLSTGSPLRQLISNEGTADMIVIGVDAHKRTHTLVALDAVTGVAQDEATVQASDDGALNALRFAGGVDQDRVWAVEDCRHVTARLERALLGAGGAGDPGPADIDRRVAQGDQNTGEVRSDRCACCGDGGDP
jgi:hypothetical protein